MGRIEGRTAIERVERCGRRVDKKEKNKVKTCTPKAEACGTQPHPLKSEIPKNAPSKFKSLSDPSVGSSPLATGERGILRETARRICVRTRFLLASLNEQFSSSSTFRAARIAYGPFDKLLFLIVFRKTSQLALLLRLQKAAQPDVTRRYPKPKLHRNTGRGGCSWVQTMPLRRIRRPN
jgi:hypothetical protein